MLNVMVKRLFILVFIFLTACGSSEEPASTATTILPTDTAEPDPTATNIPPTQTPEPTEMATAEPPTPAPTLEPTATSVPPTEVPPTVMPTPIGTPTPIPDPLLQDGLLIYQGPNNAGFGALGLRGNDRESCNVDAYTNLVTQGDLASDNQLYYAVPIAEGDIGSMFTQTWLAPDGRIINEDTVVLDADIHQNCVTGALTFPFSNDIGLHTFEFRIDDELVFTGYMQKIAAPTPVPQPTAQQQVQTQQTQQTQQSQSVTQPQVQSQPQPQTQPAVVNSVDAPVPFGAAISLGFGMDGSCQVLEPIKKWSVEEIEGGERPFMTLAAVYTSFDLGQSFTWRLFGPNGNELLSQTEVLNGTDNCFTRDIALPNLFNYGFYQLNITFDDANIYGEVFEFTQ